MDRKKTRKYLEKEKDGQRRHNSTGVKEHSLNFCDAQEERTEHSKFSCVLHCIPSHCSNVAKYDTKSM